MHNSARLNWPLLIGAYLLIAAAFSARAILFAGSEPLLADTDDAMRMVVVRDFLAGQGWYDHLQYRLNTPFGAEIHWSRLTDLPIAGLVLLFSPLGRATAELVAAWAWPLLQLFGLLLLTARLSVRLAGPAAQLPGVILPALAITVLPEFSPGRIDHHGVQVLLTLVMAWCTIEAIERPRFAIGAALAATTSLAVGTEGLPSVATTLLAMGLIWVLLEARGQALRLFGVTLAASAMLHLVIALPPTRWFEVACDAYSGVFATLAVVSGLLLAGLTLLPGLDGRPMRRLLAGGVAGAITIGLLVLAFPLCLGGPYAALDPWLVDNWLSRISEAKPAWLSVQALPGFTIGIVTPVLVAAAVTLWRLLRGGAEGRREWLVYGLFLLVAMIVMLVQVRGARIAGPLAVPAGAWLVVAARQAYTSRRGVRHIVGLLAAWLGFAGVAITVAANMALGALGVSPASSSASGVPGGKSACLVPPAFTDLAELPPERLMTPIDLGAHMLLQTAHTVVAAPYHRNQQGVRDAFRFFNEPLDAARDILEARGISLIVICDAMPEMRGQDAAPDSFIKLLAAHQLPDWLDELTGPKTPLRVFAVMPRSGVLN